MIAMIKPLYHSGHVRGLPFSSSSKSTSKAGSVVALVAVLWMTFMTIVVMFPTTPSPDAAGMNYTVVVLGGVLLLALAYYYFPVYGGIYWFRGPQKTLESGTTRPDSQKEAYSDRDVGMASSTKTSEKIPDGVAEVTTVDEL